MGRRWGSVVVALVAVGVLIAPAGADAPVAAGWWWRLQSAAGPQLRPPGVPEGGLWVTADPSGDQAIAALRSAGGASALVLRVAEVTGTPVVVACPAASTWEPADGGSWDTRPDADCESLSVAATFGEDDLMTVPLDAFGDGAVDLVLVPDASTTGYFSVAFEPPDDDTFTSLPPATSTPATTAVASPAVAPTVAPRTERVTYVPPPAQFAAPEYEPAPPPVVAESRRTERRDAPLSTTRSRGTREPLAVVALLIVVAGWVWRGRMALKGAAEHPLSKVAFAKEHS